MHRNCNKIPLEPFIEELNIHTLFKVELYVDNRNSENIFKILKKNDNRFKRALYELLNGRYNNELYGKEKVSSKAKFVTAIKFKHGKNENFRVYCKEIIDDCIPNCKKVIMVDCFNKKSQKIDKKLKTFLEKIGSYEYTFK